MSTVQVDTINESTTGSGVTVDGVLIKDNNVDGIDVSKTGLIHLNTTTVASGSAVSTFSVESVFSASYTNYKVITNFYGTATTDQRCYMKFLYNLHNNLFLENGFAQFAKKNALTLNMIDLLIKYLKVFKIKIK